MNGIPEPRMSGDALSANPITSTEQRCFKCLNVLPLSEFYKHPKMKNGHLGKCKTCNKADVSANYRKRKPQYAAYNREREPRPEYKEKAMGYQRKGRAKRPYLSKTYSLVGRAKRDGRLNQGVCEECGSVFVEAHHDDYSKPLDVRWLCFKHHRLLHGQEVLEPCLS
jgi:ribosomal protein S27AE